MNSNKYQEMIFICSPFRSDDPEQKKKNLKLARIACMRAISLGYTPFAPHLYLPQFLDENDDEENETAMEIGLAVMTECSRVWIVGDRISEGMSQEINLANQEGIPVLHVPEKELM